MQSFFIIRFFLRFQTLYFYIMNNNSTTWTWSVFFAFFQRLRSHKGIAPFNNPLRMLLQTGAVFILLCLCQINNAFGQNRISRNTINVGGTTTSSNSGTTEALVSLCASPTTLTQSTSQSIVAGSVSCNARGLHTDNSYWRAFNLTTAFDVSVVQIGVELAVAGGAATSQPLTVNIYTNTGGAFPAGTLSLVGTANYSVANQTLSTISIPITASLPTNSQMVVEVFTPNGQAAGHQFFIGSNAGGQSAPSYITAAGCSVSTPTSTAGLGFPNMHIVMNVVGCASVSCPTFTFNGTAPIAPTASTAGVGGTGTLQTYTVPAGVTTIRLDARGAKGGITPGFGGGNGGRVQATYTVTPGDVLHILVGGKGGDGAPDGDVPFMDHQSAAGGGGATFVSKGPIGVGTLLLVAGGGGGAGSQGGGGASNNTPGNGGGSTGGGGGSFSADGGYSFIDDACGNGGKAAMNGGNGGANTCFKPFSNGGGYGGGAAGNDAPNRNNAGGGGGGGYVGGNGGGTAGGNGGSSYTNPSATNPVIGGSGDDNGSVTITVLDINLPANGAATATSAQANVVPTPPTAVNGCGAGITPTGPVISTTGTCNVTKTYTWTYTANGISKTWAFTYTIANPPLIITPNVGTITCQNGSTTINTTASGGDGVYQYSLNGGAFQTNSVFTVLAGSYTITAKDGAGCTASTPLIILQNGSFPLQCPPTVRIDANQLGANGEVLPSVSGNVNIMTQCFTPTSTGYSDKVFEVNCGVVSPQNASFNAADLANAQQVIVRTFSGISPGSSYSCFQTIFIRPSKLEDIVFPTNRTLTCPNLRTDPTDVVVNNVLVNGTGSPSSAGTTLNATISKGFTATYTDVRTTTPTGFTIQRTWTVTNCAGNTRTVVQTIIVPTCTTPSVAGTIGRENGTAVPATTLLFNSLTGRTDSTTGVNYSFANLLINSNVRVKPTRPNTDWTSGVTMLDVSLLSRHVLDINPLSSPYTLISADVNADGAVDATDMLLMQRLILHLIPALPNNNSWRFVLKNHVFRDPTNPFASDFPEILVVPNLTAALANGDFVAIKVGDINQSAGAVTIRGGAKAFMLNTEDMVLEKGKTYQIPIQMTPSVSSLQFTLNVDKTAAKIESIKTGNLPNFTDNNTGLFQKEGIITTAWYRKDGQSLSETDNFIIMTVSLIPTKTTRLSEIMSINSAYTEGIAYDAKGNASPVQLAFDNKTASTEKAVLLPNRPNPFSNETTLSFTLPEASKAKLTVFDLLGKVLVVREQEFAKGLNEVVFDAKDTPSVSSGIFIVRLQTATAVAEQKIVLQR